MSEVSFSVTELQTIRRPEIQTTFYQSESNNESSLHSPINTVDLPVAEFQRFSECIFCTDDNAVGVDIKHANGDCFLQ